MTLDKKVLIVDDEYRESYNIAIGNLIGNGVDFPDKLEGVEEKLRTTQYSGILMDNFIDKWGFQKGASEEITGTDLCRFIRESRYGPVNKETPIFATSGYVKSRDVSKPYFKEPMFTGHKQWDGTPETKNYLDRMDPETIKHWFKEQGFDVQEENTKR